VDGDEVVQVYVVPTAATLTPPPPYIPTRFLVGFQRVPLAAGAATPVNITLDTAAAFTMTADAAGTRGLVAGAYALEVTRGVGDGSALSVPVTVTTA
jgi:beta-glucosidase